LSGAQLEQIWEFAQEIATREGCVLYDLEFRDGPQRVLRVFIDRETGGVSIEDCANVSRGLNLRLDVEDAIMGGAYDLEVSSPGLDRKLTKLWHFEKVVSKVVALQYRDETGVIKSYTGKLVKVEGSNLGFENAKGPFELDFPNVQKAKVQPEDVLGKKPMPGKKKR
jgi:ribosome maturation factor RimP